MSIEQDIGTEAKRLGFAAVGFAALAPSESFPVFDQWLESGRSAGMDYLKKHKSLKSHLREVAHGARSAIVVAADIRSAKRRAAVSPRARDRRITMK